MLAISTLNGVDLGGRRILVREDREDRDVKQAPAPGEEGAAPRPARGAGRGGRGGRGEGRGRGRGEGRGRGPPPEKVGESSGLQVGASPAWHCGELSML